MNVEEIDLLKIIVLTPKSGETSLKVNKTDVQCLTEKSPYESLYLAAVCLNRFVRVNFVGPPVADDCVWSLSVDSQAGELDVDAESPNCNARDLDYLLLVKWITVDFGNNLQEKYPSVDLWAIRCLFLWQKLLPDKSNSLKLKCLEYAKSVEMLLQRNGEQFTMLNSLIYTELSYVYLFYYEYKYAENVLSAASKLSDMNVRLSGVLGRKTKFQQTDVAQLVLEVGSKNSQRESESYQKTMSLPTDCNLNDDTLLEKTAFLKSGDIDSTVSSANEQCILLAMRKLAVDGKALDELSSEESQAYLDKLLNNPQNWVIQTSALFARCQMELNSRRKIERSLSQLEELVQQFSSNSKGNSDDRLRLFFACESTPIWNVEKCLAQVLVRLGAARSALDIFLRLKMWTDAVNCYKQLNMLDRAESLIRDRLAEGESPQMLCLLGDITMSEDYYVKAWKVSGGRYAEAKKRLGFLYFGRKLYEKAVESFQEATRLQPLQKDTWFTLGHCAVQINRHDVAVEAYHRCVAIEADDFESWNNLAAAYVQLDRKEQAFLILQEAVRCNYDNWKLWDNVVLLSADVGRFEECVRGLHRLLDLKDKYYDTNVLAVLVDATTSNSGILDHLGEPASRLKPELRRYFGRVTSSVTSDPILWRLYADLSKPCSDFELTDELEWEKYFGLLRKAHSSAVQKTGWEKNLDECLRVLVYDHKMAKACLKLIEFSTGDDKKAQWKASARLALKPVVGTIERYYCVDDHGKLTEEKLFHHFQQQRDILKLLE